MIGDEKAYPLVQRADVHRLIRRSIRRRISLCRRSSPRCRRNITFTSSFPARGATGKDRDMLNFWQTSSGPAECAEPGRSRRYLRVHRDDDRPE